MWGLRVPPRCITAPPGATAARSRPLKLTVVRRNRAGQRADMVKALSVDLRTRVLAAVAGGATHREAAERFGVSAAGVSR